MSGAQAGAHVFQPVHYNVPQVQQIIAQAAVQTPPPVPQEANQQGEADPGHAPIPDGPQIMNVGIGGVSKVLVSFFPDSCITQFLASRA